MGTERDESGPQTVPPAPPAEEGVAKNRGVITVCMILATVMVALDGTIANVALPYMQGALSASQDQIDWVLTSYIVASAIMTAPVGFFSAKFGRARLFLFAVVGFTLASVLCGAAQTLNQVVAFRVLQGMCGASIVPLSQSVVFDIYPPARRGFAMSLWAMGVNLGPILGPTLGGWLTQDYNWRWVFYINVPVGMLCASGILFFMKDTASAATSRMDWISFGALSLAIGGLQLVLDRGETQDWYSSREIIIETVLACAGFYIFLVQTAITPKPFLSPLLFMNRNFVVGIILYFVAGMDLYTTLALLAPYLQEVMNYPVITTGMVLAPRGAGTMIGAMVVGRLVRATGPRPLIMIGLGVTAIELYEMTLWTPDISAFSVGRTSFIQGLGVSLLAVPLTVATFSTLGPVLRTEGSGVYNLMRNIGSALGISITGAMLVRNTQVNHAIIGGFVTPFNHLLQAPVIERFWGPMHRSGAALLDAQITRQATIIAYNDNFRLLLLLTLAAIPLALLIRMPRE